jgi:hypothetical protein
MPLHVVVLDNDSKFYGGLAQGNCEYYDTTKSKALKGYMSNSILVGPNNILILFTATTFQYFIGQYINDNKPNGNMIVYNFIGNGDPLNEIVDPITVSKSNCVYSNGTLVSTSFTENIQVNIEVTYKYINGVSFLISFTLVEV